MKKIVLLLLSVSLLSSVHAEPELLVLENVMDGDKFIVSPVSRLSRVSESEFIFPIQSIEGMVIKPISIPETTKALGGVSGGNFKDLLAVWEDHQEDYISFKGRVYLLTSEDELQNWQLSADLHSEPLLTKTINLSDSLCKKRWLVTLSNPKNSIPLEIIYCLAEEGLLFFNWNSSKASNPRFQASSFKSGSLLRISMKDKFRYLRGQSGNIILSYNFVDHQQTIDNADPQVLILRANRSGQLEESVIKLSSSMFADGASPSNIIDFSIRSVDEGFKASLITSTQDIAVIYSCDFSEINLLLENCEETMRFEMQGVFVSRQQIESVRSAEGNEVTRHLLYFETDAGLLARRLSCQPGITVSATERCTLGEFYQEKLADRPVLPHKLGISSNESGVMSYFSKKERLSSDLLFSQIFIQGKTKFIYGSQSQFMIPLFSNEITIGMTNGGILSFYLFNSTKLMIEVNKIRTTEVNAPAKLFYFDSQAEKVDYFLIQCKPLDQKIVIQNSEDLHFTLTNQSSKLRFTIDQIQGPFNIVELTKSSDEPDESPKIKLVEEVQHYDLLSNGSLIKLEDSLKAIGTQDYHLDLDTNVLRICRQFARNLSEATLQVMCRPIDTLNFEKVDLDRIENVEWSNSRVFIVYSKASEGSEIITEICYLMINLKARTSSNDCVLRIDGSSFSSQIVMDSELVYALFSDGQTLEGVYIKEHGFPIKLQKIKPESSNYRFSVRKIGTREQLPVGLTDVPEVELTMIKNGALVKVFFKKGRLVANEMVPLPWPLGETTTFVCSSPSSSYFGNKDGLYEITKKGEVFPFTLGAQSDESMAITHMECLENGSIFLRRGDSYGYNLFPNFILSARNRRSRQSVFGFQSKRLQTIEGNFMKDNHQYLYSSGSNKIFLLNKQPQIFFGKSKKEKPTSMLLQVNDPRTPESSTIVNISCSSVFTPRNQNFSTAIQSKTSSIDQGHMDVEYFPVVTGNEGHFFKFESMDLLQKKGRLTVINRFMPLDIKEVPNSKFVNFLHKGDLIVDFDEVNLLIYELYTEHLLARLHIGQHDISKLLNLKKINAEPPLYSLLARTESVSKKGIIRIDFSKKPDNRFVLTSKKNLEVVLEEEDIEITTLFVGENWLVGFLEGSNLNTLTIMQFSTGKVIFSKAFVDKYSMFSPNKYLQTDGHMGFVIYSVYGSSKLFQTKISMDTLAIFQSEIDLGVSMADFSSIHCQAPHHDPFNTACIFGGLRLYWVELGLNKHNFLQVTKKIEYYSYKNMEVLRSAIWLDEDPAKNFFILYFKRINEDLTNVLDQSGLLYYSARGDNAIKFAFGGMTNDDLISIGSLSKMRLELTTNQTVILSSSQGARYFKMEHPRVLLTNAPKIELIKGLNFAMYGVKHEDILVQKGDPSQIADLKLLAKSIMFFILATLLSILWACIHKHSLAWNDDLDDGDSQSHTQTPTPGTAKFIQVTDISFDNDRSEWFDEISDRSRFLSGLYGLISIELVIAFAWTFLVLNIPDLKLWVEESMNVAVSMAIVAVLFLIIAFFSFSLNEGRFESLMVYMIFTLAQGYLWGYLSVSVDSRLVLYWLSILTGVTSVFFLIQWKITSTPNHFTTVGVVLTVSALAFFSFKYFGLLDYSLLKQAALTWPALLLGVFMDYDVRVIVRSTVFDHTQENVVVAAVRVWPEAMLAACRLGELIGASFLAS